MAALAEPLASARPLAVDRLSDRLVAGWRRIYIGTLQPGQRLPPQYGPARTAVREAVSRLRLGGLLAARRGSDVFVAAQDATRPLDFDAAVLAKLGAVLEGEKLRRALEANIAVLPASRAAPARRAALVKALPRMEASVASRGVAVDSGRAFHRAVVEVIDTRDGDAAHWLQHAHAPIHQHPSGKTP